MVSKAGLSDVPRRSNFSRGRNLMLRFLSACSMSAILVTLASASPAHAWGCLPPIKIDTDFRFRINVRCGPANQCRAPWYSYFPYDPNLHPSQGGNPYPNWPTPFPPRDGASNDTSASRFPTWPSHFPGAPGSGAEPDSRSGQLANVASSSGSSLVAPSVWQTSFSLPPGSLSLQPLVNGMQAPSYWYGR